MFYSCVFFILAFYLASFAYASYAANTSACTSFLSKSRLVYACQAKNLFSVPSLIPPDTQVLLLPFNNIPTVSQHSFPALHLLQALSLGSQTISTSFLVEEAAFYNLPNLTSLDLGGNRHISLHPGAFKGLTKLEVLLLDSNGLNESVLESGLFKELISLRKLDLSFNRILRLHPDPSFLNLRYISSIVLKFNKINLPCGKDLQNLQGKRLDLLDLSSNPLNFNATNSCPNPFKNITLGILDISSMAWDAERVGNFFKIISGTQIKNIKMRHNGLLGSGFGFQNLKDPDEVTFSGLNSSKTYFLDLSHSFISQLAPQVFSSFPELLSLDLSYNKISRLSPGAFSGMRELVSLNLSGNLLGEIMSKSFQELGSTPLKALDLSSNHIGAVQYEAMNVLGSLESLNLRDNALNKIPPVKLPSLTLLILGQNRISNTYGLSSFCPSAKILDLSSNRLTDVRSLWEILDLSSLQYLQLGRNQLSCCSPTQSGKRAPTSGLLYLDLSDNSLGFVWKTEQCADIFMSLEKLEILNLAKNHISYLPYDLFKGLVSLHTLDLSRNHLTQIQSGQFLGLSSLKTLNLGTNSLITLSTANLEPLVALESIDLSEVTFVCGCGLWDVWHWMKVNNITVLTGDSEISCIKSSQLVSEMSLKTFFKNCQ
ncbi:toll-like receptor 5 [Spea bombifrons]|uniref:toll-like receptor 5 n=1 Tax=Spea bombifrons TaxID=233779 RepID=UPI00234B5166|nr:toll-like receptor 5 [Spea bombifrons]XP_053305397.1 toll-like receptor 5 [Spea bombifrons]